MLNSGKACSSGPGLDEMLSRNVASGRLRLAASSTAAANYSDHRESAVIARAGQMGNPLVSRL
jgi:hypothetical protein